MCHRTPPVRRSYSFLGRDCYIIEGDKYVCTFCKRSFASQPLVSQHYRFVHFKKRPRVRKCPKCDEKIPGYQRAYHLEERHSIPAPKCGVCNKRFRYPHQVVRHQQKIHMGEKTIYCKICAKNFFDSQGLKLHMVTHSNVKNFSCDVCKRRFRWENNLKDHLRIHSGDRRYECRVCGKAFVQKSGLKRHGVRHHSGVDVLNVRVG
ncbi:unnamed protein product [Colias eurytheme]|nr:unnamed protein product [Colias eurytheme]